MQKIYINTTTRQFFDKDGALFGSGYPQLPYKRSERIYIQLCTETPDAGSDGVDPETDWTKDTSYGVSGVGALLSVDNDFIRRRKGTLTEAVAVGSVSTIKVKVSGIEYYNIPTTGTLRLFDSVGNAEGFSYTSFTIDSNDVITFTLTSGSSSSKAYAVNSESDMPDSMYCQASMNSTYSTPATGLFVFDIMIYSTKLKETLEYSNTKALESLAGMELLLFQVIYPNTNVLNSFICNTTSITATLAEANSNAQLPSVLSDQMVAMIIATMGDTTAQYSADGSTWHDVQQISDNIIRFKLTGSGASGDWFMWRFKRPYVYFAYATDENGSGFTHTPDEEHPYIGNICVYENIAELNGIVDDTSAVTLNRASYYDVGTTAYAWDMNGTIYYTASSTPSTSDSIYSDSDLQTVYSTVITFVSASTRPTLTDFLDAWGDDTYFMRYIGGTTKTAVDEAIGASSSGSSGNVYSQQGTWYNVGALATRVTTLEGVDTTLTSILS